MGENLGLEERQKQVVLIEDNQSDIDIMIEAFNQTDTRKNIDVVMNGDEAINYFNSLKTNLDSGMPDLVLLDVNLPSHNGLEILRLIKGDEVLKHIPVVMLTTSSSEKDIEKCYSNHANSFFSKPSSLHKFIELISMLDSYWLQTAMLSTRLFS